MQLFLGCFEISVILLFDKIDNAKQNITLTLEVQKLTKNVDFKCFVLFFTPKHIEMMKLLLLSHNLYFTDFAIFRFDVAPAQCL